MTKKYTVEEIKEEVKKRYSEIAKKNATCCGGNKNSTKDIGEKIGYRQEQLAILPEEANLGLGCGNPFMVAEIKTQDIVLELGSGAGIDAFLAAKKVGSNGKVIGLDMTEEMIELANEIAYRNEYTNVEFRLGEIENMPIDDESVDVVISNCVLNLVPDKKKAFEEIYRVLKVGGRMSISDIVVNGKLPQEIRESLDSYAACISGAIDKESYLQLMLDAGLKDVQVRHETRYKTDEELIYVKDLDQEVNLKEQKKDYEILSILVTAKK
ncbi:MAG: arsenite methyltransferase [Candidatus Heimdallarchaeaceae archaeon]